MKSLALTAAACLLATLAGSRIVVPKPRDEEPPAVDPYVVAEMRTEHIPGLALGVMRDGIPVKSRGYGLANVELDVPVRAETIFQSGSVGKQFTATAIMMLVEEGKLGLDDSITKYLSGAPADWKGITVRNLLTQTSGIADYTDEKYQKSQMGIQLQGSYTEDQLFRRVTSLPLLFPAGSQWSYSNSGYLILGVLIHRVTGEFYGDFLQQRIFKPLGMNSTRIISEADIIPNRAAGYEWVNGQLKNQKWVSPTVNTTADGALYFNILDLAKWDAALYTTKLLKKSSLDEMWTPVKLKSGKSYPYGFGWRVSQQNDHTLIEHGGAWQGFSTHISRYVDDKFTVVVLCNLDSDHADPEKIAHHVAGIYIPALAPKEGAEKRAN